MTLSDRRNVVAFETFDQEDFKLYGIVTIFSQCFIVKLFSQSLVLRNLCFTC